MKAELTCLIGRIVVADAERGRVVAAYLTRQTQQLMLVVEFGGYNGNRHRSSFVTLPAEGLVFVAHPELEES